MNVKPECEEKYELMKEIEATLQILRIKGTREAIEEMEMEYERAKKKYEECENEAE